MPGCSPPGQGVNQTLGPVSWHIKAETNCPDVELVFEKLGKLASDEIN